MAFAFTKWQGCGNDFVLVDGRTSGAPQDVAELSRQLGCRVVEISALKGTGVTEAAEAAVAAANAALNSFSKEMLCLHLQGCVAEHVRDGDDSVIAELSETLKMLLR